MSLYLFSKSAFKMKYLAEDNGKTIPMVEMGKKGS